VFSEELQLYVLLAVPHQTGSQRIQCVRADHEAVRRNSLIHGLLKNAMHITITNVHWDPAVVWSMVT
jgi:hypothetical protein